MKPRINEAYGCLPMAGLFILVALGVVWLAGEAKAHDWYTDKRDPVSRASCCGGSDCAAWAIQPGNLTATADGYQVRLTLEETKKINLYSVFPIDALVRWNRVQPSEDGNWHLCIAAVGRGQPNGGIFCLFAPPNT